MTAADTDLSALRSAKGAVKGALFVRNYGNDPYEFSDKHSESATARRLYDATLERLGNHPGAAECHQAVEATAELLGYPPTPDPPWRPMSLQDKKAHITAVLNYEIGEEGGPFYGYRWSELPGPPWGRPHARPAMDRVMERARQTLPGEAYADNPWWRTEEILARVVHRASRELGLRGDHGCGKSGTLRVGVPGRCLHDQRQP